MDLSSELTHWNLFLNQPKGKLYILNNLNMNKELDVDILSLIPQEKEKIYILDVGCGPLSVLGKSIPGKSLELTCVDPLMDKYMNILSKMNIIPPYSVYTGTGENLHTLFPTKKFDVVYSRNALDHAQYPHIAINSMLKVCAVGGVCVIEVFMNEAINSNYIGLHQWNFCIHYEHILLWSPFDAFIMEKIINGLPYRFSIIPGDVNKKNPYAMKIYIYNIDKSKFINIYKNIFVTYSKENKYISLYRNGALQSTERFFLHGRKQGKLVYNKGFTWFGEIEMKSFCPEEFDFDYIEIGQYIHKKVNGNWVPVNIWKKSIALAL